MAEERCDLLCLDLPNAESVRAQLPALEAVWQAAERARELGDATRPQVAPALAVGGELRVRDLAWVSGSTQNAVSHDVRQLHAAGLAASRRDGKLVLYRLTAVREALLAEVTSAGASPAPAAAP